MMRQLRLNEKVEFSVGPKVTIRFYADCRPNALQTSKLQKGGVLVFNGMELVEEGLGIGAPICLYGDGARFSLNATTFVNDSSDLSVIKIYSMSAMESKRFRGANIRHGGYASQFLRSLEKAYRGIRSLQLGATAMLRVVSMMGLRNEYVEGRSKGQIAVTYQPSNGGLVVNVDFHNIETDDLRSLILGNEQGGRLFTNYSDSSGVKMSGREIEPWKPTSAERATLFCPATGVGFRLRRPSGWQIVRGREVVTSRISWAGLNLKRDTFPTSKTVRYSVKVFRGSSI